MNRKRLTCIVLTALSSVFLWGPLQCYGLTLEDILKLAIEQDAQLQADIKNAEAQEKAGWKAVGEYGASLRLSGSYMKSWDRSSPEHSAEKDDRDAEFYEATYQISFQQPLIDLEKLSEARRGLTVMEISHLKKKQALEDLSLKVHERYYKLLSNRANLGLAQAEILALKEQLNNAREKLALGFGTITDMHNAEARYSLAKASEVARQSEEGAAVRALEELINRELIERVDDIDFDAILPELYGTESYWLDQANNHNTEITVRRFEEKVAELKYQGVKSRFLPSLKMFADYSQRNPDDSLAGYGERRTEFDVGVQINLDLLSGGRDTAETVSSFYRFQAAQRETAAVEREVKRSVRSFWQAINNNRILIEAYRTASEANRKAMEATRSSYNEGVLVLIDVLDSQQDYYRSLREYKTARYDYMILLERFRQMVGSDETILISPIY